LIYSFYKLVSKYPLSFFRNQLLETISKNSFLKTTVDPNNMVLLLLFSNQKSFLVLTKNKDIIIKKDIFLVQNF
jgi:hypothetical protein